MVWEWQEGEKKRGPRRVRNGEGKGRKGSEKEGKLRRGRWK